MTKKLVVSAVALLFATLFLALAIVFPAGYLKGGDVSYLVALVIALVCFAWGLSMVYRTQFKTQKKLILTLIVSLFVWITLRFIKWLPNIHYISIYVDYAYYIPMMGIPILFMLLIGESFYTTKKAKVAIYVTFSLIATVFIVLSLTNDLHHLIYNNIRSRFAEDNPGIEIITYGYGVAHYVAMVYVYSLVLFDFVMFVIGTRKQVRIRELALSFVVMILLATYTALYFAGVDFIKNVPILKDFALMMTVLIMLLLESLLFVGLIQNNGRYHANFKKSIVPMRIFDDGGNIVYTTGNFDEIAYDFKDAKYNYIQKPIGSYTLVVEERVDEINSLKNKISLENEKIKNINRILEETIKVTGETPALAYRIELSDEIEESIQQERRDAQSLISSLPDEINDKNRLEVERNLGKIALLLGYMKQKCMLLLELKRTNTMSFDACKMLLNVITKDIASVGFFDATYSIITKCDVDISFLVVVNEFINKVAQAYAFSDAGFIVMVDTKNSRAIIELDSDGLEVKNINVDGARIKGSKDDSVRLVLEVAK